MYAVVGILLFIVLLYYVVVLAYDFCNALAVYHPVGGDGFCDILDFFQGNLAELSKESDVDDVVL